MEFLFAPPLIVFILSYFKISRTLMAFIASTIFFGVIYTVTHPFINDYFYIDKLGSFVLVVSSIVAVAVFASMISLPDRIKLNKKSIKRFYRFFAVFWIGIIISILSNNMGLYWVGLEFATLSTVYMIKVKVSKEADIEAWRYLIVGAIAISLILFGIILIYAASKDVLGENAMNFYSLINNTQKINDYLFELGFIFVMIGMFIKMGFFPMNLWLADIERASVYQVGALFSGILESAIILGFFRFSMIEKHINYSHLIGIGYTYILITLFFVSFLIYRAKDFVRLFSLSGIEHMSLIALFWISGGYFAALLHFAAHAFMKPGLFISSQILEQNKKYIFKGTLKNLNKFAAFMIGAMFLGVISLPPSPMFFSEIYGFKAMIDIAKDSNYFFLMIGAVFILLILLSIIFYRFVHIYQDMQYIGDEKEKTVYKSEMIAILILFISTALLLLPQSFDFIEGIMK
ncbi:proton-conducting transporter membrane subunit [Caminibacter pacificus]|uniref:Hydrogenase n=1 Tax=Caminibacter pacificus TaxID=1424653 RepID=A0AAJ4UXQ4_9BACT|nr:proton-conducting transporter membrane subunit [Caminibacter pacificus]QCI27917.1 hydrogenase [Caminibacter pacificus]ROR39905.1 hydrogenase-4 component F [Caminibacter pacificus]